jgi:hypothetical protein
MKPNSVSISASNWDRSKPAESFKAFARQIHGKAKEMLIRDGSHAEMFFCLPLGGHGHVVLWDNNDRDKEAGWLRKHIARHYVYGVIHVAEGWMRMAMSADDFMERRDFAG